MKAPMLLVLLTISTAQAAEPTGTLTLACQGTVTDGMQPDPKPEPVSMSITINFNAHTIAGFDAPSELKILDVNEVTIRFGSSVRSVSDRQFVEWIVGGTLDRTTGDVAAMSSAFDPKTRAPTVKRDFSLKCKPTQRMF
jgi:hypothetical protein